VICFVVSEIDMARKSWRKTPADLVLKVPLFWFANAGIQLALTILVMPALGYLLYPSVVDAIGQISDPPHYAVQAEQQRPRAGTPAP
jgi:hypothetical protein